MGRGALQVALAWLAHPVSLAGIALLLLNDHVLKAEYGAWWTGKLSDVAGLVFAPALLAVVVAALGGHRGRPRTVAASSLAIVGVGFVWVKATAGGAAAASAAWTAVAGPSLVRHDATDLLALPALALAWLAYRQATRRPDATRHPNPRTVARALILVPIATFAVAATSVAPTYMASDVAVVDGKLYVGVEYLPDEGSGYPPHPPDWHSTDVSKADPATWSWEYLREPDDEEAERASQAGDSQKTEACVPGDPTICYRIVDGALGVERSNDGGETWSPEWGFTSSERDRLIVLTPEVFDPDTQFVSRSLAVFEVGDGHEVVVANGLDGIAVRMTKGTWSRHQVPG
ncbi:MAG: hypothetical protein MUP36_02390, partial [Demequinaceae bacterium]|nr:hypothetical protein [Demequinaceae bacterium]